MNIIKPQIITEPLLVATNVPENDYPVWTSTSYNAGERVIYNHKIYEAIQNNNNSQPDLNPLDWLDLGATNRYRMFDNIVGNPTTNPNTIDFTVQTGTIIDGIAFFNVVAASIQVIVTDPVEGEVYNTILSLEDFTDIVSCFAYWFNPVGDRNTEIAFLDLGNYPQAEVRVIIDNGAENAVCGEVVLGTQRVLGITNFGTSIGIRDYSRKEVDDFGSFTIVERTFSKLADYEVTMESSNLASVQRYLASIRATPVVYIGDPNRGETIIYGFYKGFNIVIATPTISEGTIQVEGLT